MRPPTHADPVYLTADEYLARARALLGDAYDMWVRYGGDPWPTHIAQWAAVAADIGRGYVELSRELRIRDELPALLGRDMQTAPASPAQHAGADNQNPLPKD